MENLISEHRKRVAENIEKSFNGDLDIEKARSGVYADTAENRKLQRVGQHYGGRKQEQPTAGQPRAKKQEEQPKGGGEQKPDTNSRADIYNNMSDGEKSQINNVLHSLKIENPNGNKLELKSKDDKQFEVIYDGKSSGVISKEQIKDDVAKKIGWLKEGDGNKGNGESNKSDIPNSYGRVKREDYEYHLDRWKDANDSSLVHFLTDKDVWPSVKAAAETILLDRGKNNLVDRAKRLLKREQNIPNNSIKIVNAVKTAGEGNGGFVTTKSGLSALKNLRKAVENFAKKNPDVEFDDEMASALVELPVDEFIDEYGDYNGLEEFGEALEQYGEALEEYTGDEEDEKEELRFEKELRKRKDDARKDVIAALEADQGGLLDDEDSKKKIEAIQQAAVEFVEKNPDLKITTNGWETIVDGMNINKYKKYDGFEKLNNCIENYF